MLAAGGFAFGPFRLDSHTTRLTRDGALVPLPARCFDLLLMLVSRAGDIVTKDDLVRAAWPANDVGDNSLAKAISQLRDILDSDNPTRYIRTVSAHGYRFVEPVTRIDVRQSDAALDALVAQHQRLIDGRAGLETFEWDQILRWRAEFEALLGPHGDDARVHVGLANACAMQFEGTRAKAEPDTEALRMAVKHGYEACRLDPNSAEAWATRGYVLGRAGDRVNGLVSLRHGVTVGRYIWMNWLRLSDGSWGEERLRAAHETIKLRPNCPMAHCLAATVFIGRDALAEAEREIDAGIAMVDAGGDTPERFAIVGLYWLKALLCRSRGAADDEVRRWFDRELALEPRGHFYAPECCANTWYGIGAMHLRSGDADQARAAFTHAIARVPRHPMALAGLALLTGQRPAAAPDCSSVSVDEAMARAVWLQADGAAAGAAKLVAAALAASERGSNAGWLVPVDPLLDIKHHRADWMSVLATLLTRAS